jgi:conjugal transfer pilus assembly protein TraB
MANDPKPAQAEASAEQVEAVATPESRREQGRRNLNRQIAQRQKLLLVGVGAIALIGGATFLFSGDDAKHAGAAGDPVTIDTGGLVNRNLSEREFVATYGNRADAQDREIKALKEGQVPGPSSSSNSPRSRARTRKCAPMASTRSMRSRPRMQRSSRSSTRRHARRQHRLPPPPAYGPGAGAAAERARSIPGAGPGPDEQKVSLMSFETGAAGPKKPADRQLRRRSSCCRIARTTCRPTPMPRRG